MFINFFITELINRLVVTLRNKYDSNFIQKSQIILVLLKKLIKYDINKKKEYEVLPKYYS